MAGLGRKFYFLAILIPTFIFAAALKVEEVPNPQTTQNSFVTDKAEVLGSTYVLWFDSLSKNLEQATSVELAVVTVDNLDQLSIEEFAVRLFKLWGIGKKSEDNGVLLLFSLYDRKVRIEVGYGLEGILTDALSKRIIYSEGIPYFKQGLYAQGLYRMAIRISEVISAHQDQDLGIKLPVDWPPQVTARPKAPPQPILKQAFSNPWIKAGALPGLSLLSALVLFIYQLGRFQFSPAKAAKEKALSGFYLPLTLMWALGFFGALTLSGFIGYVGRTILMAGGAAAGFSVLVNEIRKSRSRWLKTYHAPCPECSSAMKLYNEYDDNAFLLEEEIAEEKVKGMDYEFWRCPQCDLLERFEVKLPWAKSCPKCSRRTQLRTSRVLRSATRTSTGTEKITLRCHNPKCDYIKEYTKTIPKVPAPSSSSGSSWGSSSSSSGSFGGGSSGGGGASGGW